MLAAHALWLYVPALTPKPWKMRFCRLAQPPAHLWQQRQSDVGQLPETVASMRLPGHRGNGSHGTSLFQVWTVSVDIRVKASRRGCRILAGRLRVGYMLVDKARGPQRDILNSRELAESRAKRG
jgi:hypothetical protein